MGSKSWLIGVAVLVLAAGGWWWSTNDSAPQPGTLTIESSEVERGSVRRVVAATGSVRALVTVEVGSQVSGQIAELNVDFNDQVEAGQIIARIDPQSIETRVREAEASRANAAATLQLQRASLERVRANVISANLEFSRIETLHERGTASQAALDNAQASLDVVQADLSVATAQIASARANLQQRDATLDGARIDLERTYIRAPISGVVVDRAVDQGQTVAASLSAPTLFTIAQDLRRIQVDAQIDEADIGQIAQGQPVSFTVDAYPDLSMTGEVDQIRLAPITLQNVVTYTVVVSANNPGQRLLPGMTANLDIITGERNDVLTVPNSALRFRPSPALEGRTQPLPEGGAEGGRGGAGQGGPGGGGPGGGGGRGGRGGGRGGPGAAIDRMAEQLDMDQAQQDAAREVMQGIFSRIRSSGQRPDRSAIQAELTRALQDILTEEQMQLYRTQQREAQETRTATVWVQEAGGDLVERRVRVGIGDSQRSEIVRGQLEAGETVVTRVREAR
jgi:HlyD family secretion protein